MGKRVQPRLTGDRPAVTWTGPRGGRQLELFSPLDAVPGAVEDAERAFDTWAGLAAAGTTWTERAWHCVRELDRQIAEATYRQPRSYSPHPRTVRRLRKVTQWLLVRERRAALREWAAKSQTSGA